MPTDMMMKETGLKLETTIWSIVWSKS